MPTALDPQLGLDEKVVDDEELLALLDRRSATAAARTEAARAHKVVHDQAMKLIEKHDLAEGAALRVGPYRLTVTRTPEDHREFDVAASERINIKRVG
jgi:hypothetical protein